MESSEKVAKVDEQYISLSDEDEEDSSDEEESVSKEALHEKSGQNDSLSTL